MSEVEISEFHTFIYLPPCIGYRIPGIPVPCEPVDVDTLLLFAMQDLSLGNRADNKE